MLMLQTIKKKKNTMNNWHIYTFIKYIHSSVATSCRHRQKILIFTPSCPIDRHTWPTQQHVPEEGGISSETYNYKSGIINRFIKHGVAS